MKPLSKVEKSKGGEKVAMGDKNGAKSSPLAYSVSVPSILRRQESLVSSNPSLNASCSSDASVDSIRSRASTGRICWKNSKTIWKKQLASKARNGADQESLPEVVQDKRRCSWAAVSTDPTYLAFHDEEWGVPAHDDKKLLESSMKLRSIIENACRVLKVIDEFGSFDSYIWSFVNHKQIISSFRLPRQLPIKSPKAELISKDLVRRNFRGVGQTVVYSFMQVSGLTNDHLITCFRFHHCNL